MATEFFLYAILILELIWKIRNGMIHDGKIFDLAEAMSKIKDRFEDFSLCQRSDRSEGGSNRNLVARRNDLCPRTVLLSMEISIMNGSCFSGIVERDHRGHVLSIITSRESSEVAELMAIARGLDYAKSRGWKHLRCESDARVVIKAIIKSDYNSLHWTSEAVG